jgi:hypothetical protein
VNIRPGSETAAGLTKWNIPHYFVLIQTDICFPPSAEVTDLWL